MIRLALDRIRHFDEQVPSRGFQPALAREPRGSWARHERWWSLLAGARHVEPASRTARHERLNDALGALAARTVRAVLLRQGAC